MHYLNLLTAISNHGQNTKDITIEIDGEFYPGTFKFVDDDDRLDEGHLVITLKKDTAPWEDVMHIEDGWGRY